MNWLVMGSLVFGCFLQDGVADERTLRSVDFTIAKGTEGKVVKCLHEGSTHVAQLRSGRVKHATLAAALEPQLVVALQSGLADEPGLVAKGDLLANLNIHEGCSFQESIVLEVSVRNSRVGLARVIEPRLDEVETKAFVVDVERVLNKPSRERGEETAAVVTGHSSHFLLERR